MTKIPRLKTLELAGISIIKAKILKKKLYKLTNLKYLVISRNEIQPANIKISQLVRLESPTISFNFLDNEGSYHIARALINLQKLINLNIILCFIGYLGINFIVEGINI